jgi:diguanylate cyclase (GGDEF)-like protein
MQGRFDAAQREKEILLLKRDNELKSATLEAKQLQQGAVWLVGSVLIVAAGALALAYRRVRKINQALGLSNAELAFQSDHDPLTGLFNRRSLQLFLELSGQAARAGEAPRPSMGFVLADIDHFKQVNDVYGHAAGDAVLVEFARRLSSLVRPGDRLFRWGGEEFLLLLPQGSSAGLADLCRRILDAVAHEPFEVEGQHIRLTVSLGACPFPLRPEAALAQDWQRHLHFADLALYRSKTHGRNRAHDIVEIADGSPETLDALESDLGAAAAQGLATVRLIEPSPQ